MQYYLNLFTRILLLRAAPSEVPASPALFWLVFMALLGLALVRGLFLLEPLDNFVFNIVNLGMMLAFVYALLYLVKRSPRFLQTAIAVCGVNVLFYLLDFPAYWLLVSEALPQQHLLVTVAALYLYALLVFSVVVFGHILRHAMELSTVAGVLIALGYYVANIWFMRTVFPEIAA
jgi:hypothetical protein